MRTKEIPDFGPGEPGTVEALFHAYRQSWDDRPAEAGLKPATRDRYDQALRVAASTVLPTLDPSKPFSAYLADDVTQRHARLLLDRMGKLRSAKQANFAAGIASQAFYHGVEYGLCRATPFAHVRRHRVSEPRVSAWTEAEQEAMIGAAKSVGRPVVAKVIRLAAMVAQRPCDILALRGRNYDHATGRLTLRTHKTGAGLDIPLPEAAPFFAGLGPDDPVFVDDEAGVIDTPAVFRPLFREVRKVAGVRQDLWLADLRRTVLTRMHVAGATEDELLDLSRHRKRQQLQTYIARTPRTTMGGLDKLRRSQGGSL